MQAKKAFSCYLIGDDNITLQCASIILAKNHQLLGLISSSKSIQKWCQTNAIPYIKNLKEFAEHHMHNSCDFLFSVANGFILPPSILTYPRFYAINYHNSPLPKYAGLYATSWAILNNEKEHAISWHIMDEKVDAGDILKQPYFSIEEDETALSLNLKCYEHAVRAFEELVDELSINSVNLAKQNLSFRSYYGLRHKPDNFGFISWNKSSNEIDRLCRALTFGHYKNELATPKIIVNDEVYVINSYRKLGISTGEPPGTIVHISSTDIQITTQTTDIVLYELMNLAGVMVPIDRLIELHKLARGQKLPEIDKGYIECLMAHPAITNPKYEQFWVKEYLQCIHGGVSFLSPLIKLDDEHSLSCQTHKRIKIPEELQKKVTLYSQKKNSQVKTIIFTLLLTYLYRLNNYVNFSWIYSSSSLKEKVGFLGKILENYLPLTSHLTAEMVFSDVLSFIEKENERLISHETYCKDIFCRYPELNGLTNEIDISISFFKPKDSPTFLSNKKLNFYLSEDASWILVHNQTNYKVHEESFAFFNNMEQHLCYLLKDVLNHPDKKLFELSFLSENEENCLLKVWNDTKWPYDTSKLLHQYIEAQVVKTPHSLAAIFNEETITYEELNKKSNQVAHCLISNAIKPNDIIGIYLHRSMNMLISILGVLKSGAAYLPLDPHYPHKRINYMLENSQSKILLTDEKSVSKHIHDYKGLIIDVEKILKNEEYPSTTPLISTKSSDLAYVIYTSGTTGTPKGVAIPQKATCNHMVWMKNAYDFNEQDVFLQKTPFSFDASVWEFFMPLLVGGRLVLAPDDSHASPKELINLVIKHKVNILQLVPSMLREMTLTEGFDKCTSLRHIFCGGEVLLPETIHTFFEHNWFGCLLHNLYGPSEATIDSVTQTCSPNDALLPVSRIGKPISNAKVFVLDEKMQLVPMGILGELYISGDGLAKGYLNNEALTQQKFLPNPFGTQQDELVYKTGDLVKWQSHGILEYHERRDSQIKIRGFRIEISEIESCLDKIPCIYQCLVKPESAPNGALTLSAYLVLIDNEQITAAEIRSFLKSELPDYMIPTRFFVVEKLLTTPSGKLDRKHPPTPLRQLNLAQEHLAPQNELEKGLQEIWCSVLKTNDLGIYDDFFEMGGHSLAAMNIISQIKEKFSIHLSMRKLFDFSTIHSLAIEIEQLLQVNENCNSELSLSERIIIPIKESGNQTPLFLIHPIGGSIFWYKSLGKYLHEDVPLYGLQDPGLETQDFFFQDLEQMANTYIKAIQTIQPKGPYLIGGASFGSTVAVEIAKQLQDKNEKILAILSLDGWAEYPALQRNEEHFKVLMQEQNKRILEQHLQNKIQHPENLLELQWQREKMLMHYKLPRIRSKFILCKAETLTDLFNYDAPLNWWENYSEEKITCYLVPGDHETMFSEPHIKVLANKLNELLNSIHNTML
ncbi:amino acid adenylation domain-containing protein [Legionella jamestowniensis]|uniref:Peptide synthetase, non-ribosomal n=1 Tax=Legionella jamestowniensis TaxID=455 RepID=A0A0W0UGK7_9GAMM|nr:amino acid adenylation domain-containing protein [Legionella jamestowniensis]KTD06954.1 peptide synthetase, non-ribosomal [Legionella jamestowniensis]SFL84559.1 amino acid adenylation domain-containing protein [Legionella jamestowniensis DSM 19215]